MSVLDGLEDGLSLREVVTTGGASTIMVLTALNLVDDFDRAAFAVLAPDIQNSLGLSDAALASINGLTTVFTLAGALIFGRWGDRSRRRPLIVAATSVVWTVMVVLAGLARSGLELAVARFGTGVVKANEPVSKSILADQYPIEGRVRMYAAFAAANPVGNMIGPVVAGVVAVLVGGSAGWRWAFVVLAVPSTLLALFAVRLRDPQRGQHEQRTVLGAQVDLDTDVVKATIPSALARLKKIRTYHKVMVAIGIIGVGQFAVPIILNLHLEQEFGLNAAERGLVGGIQAAGLAAGLLIGGRIGDRRFKHDVEGVVRFSGIAIACYGVLYPLALLLPHVALAVGGITLVQACLAAAVAPLDATIASVTPHRIRAMGFAMRGLYGAVGGVAGSILFGLFSDAFGEQASLLLLLPPVAIVGGATIYTAAGHVRRDLETVAAELREDVAERQVRSAEAVSGAVPPALQVRGLDFSYGQLQVLFDVNLDVRTGEVLALLGTNGAGKSTLLRAISGLDLPDRGVIRLEGQPIGFASAEDRVAMGIVQVPGGKAIFEPLTVRENLLAGAYTYIWDRKLVAHRVDEVTELFPRLRERLGQQAGTLSGGEQQMLAIAKALMLEPRLLLIDELSLGLAPAVVQELLGVVEQLRSRGMTMIIVEQSVNIALALASRAVFMEKGAIRFEGDARELLERDDLVRAVFLGADRS